MFGFPTAMEHHTYLMCAFSCYTHYYFICLNESDYKKNEEDDL